MYSNCCSQKYFKSSQINLDNRIGLNGSLLDGNSCYDSEIFTNFISANFIFAPLVSMFVSFFLSSEQKIVSRNQLHFGVQYVFISNIIIFFVKIKFEQFFLNMSHKQSRIKKSDSGSSVLISLIMYNRFEEFIHIGIFGYSRVD